MNLGNVFFGGLVFQDFGEDVQGAVDLRGVQAQDVCQERVDVYVFEGGEGRTGADVGTYGQEEGAHGFHHLRVVAVTPWFRGNVLCVYVGTDVVGPVGDHHGIALSGIGVVMQSRRHSFAAVDGKGIGLDL